MKTDRTLAGACGLYCGACGIYRRHHGRDVGRLEPNAGEVFHCQPEQIRCGGFRGPVDSHWSPDCAILACAAERGLTFCFECPDFTCDDLAAFSAGRHHMPIDNL